MPQKLDVDLTDGNFHASGDAREAHRWMRANRLRVTCMFRTVSPLSRIEAVGNPT